MLLSATGRVEGCICTLSIERECYYNSMRISSNISLGACPFGYGFEGILRADLSTCWYPWNPSFFEIAVTFDGKNNSLLCFEENCSRIDNLAFSPAPLVDFSLSFQRFYLDLSSCMKEACQWQFPTKTVIGSIDSSIWFRIFFAASDMHVRRRLIF